MEPSPFMAFFKIMGVRARERCECAFAARRAAPPALNAARMAVAVRGLG